MAGNNITSFAGLASLAAGGTLLASDAANALSDRNNYSNQYQQALTFPSDLLTNSKNICMSFRFTKYTKRSIFANTEIQTNGGIIRLPIPHNLKEDTDVSYNNTDLSSAVGAATEAYVSNNPSSSDFKSIASGLASVGGGFLAGNALSGLESLNTGTAAQAFQAVSGISVNPFQTVLFQSPNFRTHSFNWTFAPSNSQESETLTSIIRMFQYHALPGLPTNSQGLLFDYPEIVLINILPSDTYLYKFKPCVIKNISVNYAAGNTPSFFKSKTAPTMVSISLHLMEIEMWTKNDYLQNIPKPNGPSQ